MSLTVAAVVDLTRGAGLMAYEWAGRAYTGVALLATGSSPKDVDPSTGKGPEWGKAAPIGLLVIVLLGVACYFLARSFSRNLKRVPPSFGDGDAASGGASADHKARHKAGDTPSGAKIVGGSPGPASKPSGRNKTGKRR